MPEDILLESVPDHIVDWLQQTAEANGQSMTEVFADLMREVLDLPMDYSFGQMNAEIIQR